MLKKILFQFWREGRVKRKSSLNFPILAVFVCSTLIHNATPGIVSPCDFPTPDRRGLFYDKCTRYQDLPYLCDYDQIFSKSGADKIDNVISGHFGDVFDKALGKVQIGIVVLKTLQLPNFIPQDTDISTSNDFICLSGYTQLSFGKSGSISDALVYSQVVSTIIRKKWFSTDCGLNLLVLAITDGILAANGSTMIVPGPVINLSFSSQMYQILKRTKKSAENFAKEALVKGWPLAATIQKTLEILGRQVREAERTYYPKPYHTIPRWAWYTAFLCVALITLAMFLEWILVRRGGLTLRSGGGGGDTGAPKKGMSKEGGPRTHMYF